MYTHTVLAATIIRMTYEFVDVSACTCSEVHYTFFQVIEDDTIENLVKVCHSDSYEKLEATVKVNNRTLVGNPTFKKHWNSVDQIFVASRIN